MKRRTGDGEFFLKKIEQKIEERAKDTQSNSGEERDRKRNNTESHHELKQIYKQSCLNFQLYSPAQLLFSK